MHSCVGPKYNDILRNVCERLYAQISVYPPDYVIACIRTKNGSTWLLRGTNLTVYSMTIPSPNLRVRADQTWYRPSVREYTSTLSVPHTKDVFLAHYVSTCLRALSTFAERCTFLDVCICALRGHTRADDTMLGAPSLFRDGCTSEVLEDLRRYFIEKHRRETTTSRRT